MKFVQRVFGHSSTMTIVGDNIKHITEHRFFTCYTHDKKSSIVVSEPDAITYGNDGPKRFVMHVQNDGSMKFVIGWIYGEEQPDHWR